MPSLLLMLKKTPANSRQVQDAATSIIFIELIFLCHHFLLFSPYCFFLWLGFPGCGKGSYHPWNSGHGWLTRMDHVTHTGVRTEQHVLPSALQAPGAEPFRAEVKGWSFALKTNTVQIISKSNQTVLKYSIILFTSFGCPSPLKKTLSR